MTKVISLAILFLLVSIVSGEHELDSEVELLKTPVKKKVDQEFIKVQKDFKKISDELKRLRQMFEAAKQNPADGPNSDSNINKIVSLPEKIANLSSQLDSTINALDNRELLA